MMIRYQLRLICPQNHRWPLDLFSESVFSEPESSWVDIIYKGTNPIAVLSDTYAACNVPIPTIKTLELVKTEDWLTHIPIPKNFSLEDLHFTYKDHTLHSLRMRTPRSFGVGDHPTTYTCLKALLRLRNQSVRVALDIGCGSGILSMAMHSLFRPIIHAYDSEVDAIEDCLYHKKVNNLTTLKVHHEEVTSNTKLPQADLIVCNIHLNVLRNLSDLLCRTSRGYIILSGILNEHKEELTQSFPTWHCIENFDIDGWSTVVLSPKEP